MLKIDTVTLRERVFPKLYFFISLINATFVYHVSYYIWILSFSRKIKKCDITLILAETIMRRMIWGYKNKIFVVWSTKSQVVVVFGLFGICVVQQYYWKTKLPHNIWRRQIHSRVPSTLLWVSLLQQQHLHF